MSAFPATLLEPGTANTSSDQARGAIARNVYAQRESWTERTNNLLSSNPLDVAGMAARFGGALFVIPDLVRLASPWSHLYAALDALNAIEDDWDGYGAPVPNDGAIN